jgi:hypothetical protein
MNATANGANVKKETKTEQEMVLLKQQVHKMEVEKNELVNKIEKIMQQLQLFLTHQELQYMYPHHQTYDSRFSQSPPSSIAPSTSSSPIPNMSPSTTPPTSPRVFIQKRHDNKKQNENIKMEMDIEIDSLEENNTQKIQTSNENQILKVEHIHVNVDIPTPKPILNPNSRQNHKLKLDPSIVNIVRK